MGAVKEDEGTLVCIILLTHCKGGGILVNSVHSIEPHQTKLAKVGWGQLEGGRRGFPSLGVDTGSTI